MRRSKQLRNKPRILAKARDRHGHHIYRRTARGNLDRIYPREKVMPAVGGNLSQISVHPRAPGRQRRHSRDTVDFTPWFGYRSNPPEPF